MLRTTTANLTIVVLLTCPYLCMGEVVGARLGDCQTDACSCSQGDGQSDQETPSSPADNDPDCLCHGALVDVVRTIDFDDSTPLYINWRIVDGASCSTALSLANISYEPPHHFPPFSTGRDVCALTCALLL